ncbi:chaperone DnaJ domain protein [Nitrosococcus halophilus Nc 4]|uniref:Chaperone DnaJ domain protein n=1 Tax=Nitrosococcus halophilus (strain Nc4) TaxID=472759 RepID=D5BZV4_NITHN|nr:DnaJ C-terminal domain-containing protein [Nitrosococcus halophilus]ADE16201.1 chaperone DnaJ domain protein [Nitrosococcus halophilus Nc 4]
MEYKDYYKIMGLPRTASPEEIKGAYRRLARKYHPDVSKEPQAEEHFKEINEAYEVLKDPEKRAAYDQLGSGWRTGEEFRPPPEWEQRYWSGPGGFGAADFADLGEFFESLFGGAPFRRTTRTTTGFRRPGESQHARLEVSLEDSYQGATRTITLQVPEINRQGQVVNRTRSLRVKIPKGVTQGQQIRLSGQGSPGMGGGRPGDLYLEVVFQPHPFYRPEGKDIYVDLPVAPWEAALGADLSVPTLGGEVKMKIPPGSQSGHRLRLKGRGLPGNPPGDQYVVLQVVLPQAESEAAREAYRHLANVMPFNPRRKLGM